MHILLAKTIAAGFAASIAVSGTTALRSSLIQTEPPASGTLIATLSATPAIQKATSPLDRWIERLVYLESEGKEHIKILDHNGYYSYGCLQFQKWTFINYGKRYGLVSDNDTIEETIYDCGLQKAITKKMIEENYGNWRHWYTSVTSKKLGFPPELENSDS